MRKIAMCSTWKNICIAQTFSLMELIALWDGRSEKRTNPLLQHWDSDLPPSLDCFLKKEKEKWNGRSQSWITNIMSTLALKQWLSFVSPDSSQQKTFTYIKVATVSQILWSLNECFNYSEQYVRIGSKTCKYKSSNGKAGLKPLEYRLGPNRS